MARIETWFNQDLQKPVKVQYLDGNVFSQDNNGNIVGVVVLDNNSPASISGSVAANIIRSDGYTVAVSGTRSGNKCSVILPQSAYAVPGVISIIIKLTSGSDVTTLCAVVANVYQSSTSTVVDPGTIIPSVETLIAEIETAVASIPADYSSLWTSLAPAFNSSTSYVAGQYVTYNGGLYRFTEDHSGSWSSSDVTAVNIGHELTVANSAISVLNSKATDASNALNNESLFNNASFVPHYMDSILMDNSTNVHNGAINESTGTFNYNDYRLYTTTHIPITQNDAEIYKVKTFGYNTGVAFLFWDAEDTYLGGTSYARNNGTLTVQAFNYPTIAYMTLQFTAYDEYKMGTDWLVINPVIITKQSSNNFDLLNDSKYNSFIGYFKGKNDFFPHDSLYWRIGNIGNDSTRTKLKTFVTNTRISAIYVPFNSKTFRVLFNSTDYQMYFYLHDKDKNIIDWSYGLDWINTSYDHYVEYEAGEVAYISFAIRKPNDSALTLSDVANINIHIIPLEVEPLKLRVMEYNIGHYCYGTGSSMADVGLPADQYDEKVANMKAFFAKYQPDVLGLCEYWEYLDNAKTHKSDDVLFDPIFRFKHQSTEWNALKSNFALTNLRTGQLSPSGYGQNYYLAEINNGTIKVAVMVIHFYSGEDTSIRISEMESVVSILSSYKNAIVMGDFNTEADEISSIYSPAINAGFTLSNGGYLGWFNTWYYVNPSKKLDNILVKGDFKIRNYKVLYDETVPLCSDHIPNYSDIIFFS